MKAPGALVAALAASACAPALRVPRPLDELGGGVLAVASPPAAASEVDALLAAGEQGFARRPAGAAVREAQRFFFEAARADPARVEGLIGLARVTVWRIEHEADPAVRGGLVGLAVGASQWCGRRAPEKPECDYWLAIALGQQARERHATGYDGLRKMVDALRRAAERAPEIDEGGPYRVLALVHLRAPGWPAGPGDPESGLEEAQHAASLFPEHPANQLALAEALRKNGRPDEARAVYGRALELARVQAASGHPDASEWQDEAQRALGTDR